ncbi:hypothetical protein NDU88_007655 [Pleurodeles waltl]|uniref:Uncharacterized protein n=1 Tax=Pleurodeles waltl TaxID=8319 RepID=A0AAV7ST50_PLEWA|nr:hypothetical protein NDU88_007655 [Pleurodeles waltl]
MLFREVLPPSSERIAGVAGRLGPAAVRALEPAPPGIPRHGRKRAGLRRKGTTCGPAVAASDPHGEGGGHLSWGETLNPAAAVLWERRERDGTEPAGAAVAELLFGPEQRDPPTRD